MLINCLSLKVFSCFMSSFPSFVRRSPESVHSLSPVFPQIGSWSTGCASPARNLPPAWRSSDSAAGSWVPHTLLLPPPDLLCCLPGPPEPGETFLQATQSTFLGSRARQRRRRWAWWANITQLVSDLVFPQGGERLSPRLSISAAIKCAPLSAPPLRGGAALPYAGRDNAIRLRAGVLEKTRS